MTVGATSSRPFWLKVPASIVHALRAAWSSFCADWSSDHELNKHRLSYPDIESQEMQKLLAIEGYSMTVIERRYALLQAIQHLIKHHIQGAILECGVWRGGSMMLVANELQALGDTQRDIYLCDTFTGMTEPTEHDRDWTGATATQRLSADEAIRETSYMWCIASLEDVQKNLTFTGYPPERLHYVVGPVEETLPLQAPSQIALLRLDTDWYESTAHELKHLYDRVVPGGIIIIDDYGHWKGARRAVDEFIKTRAEPIFLHRIDLTARMIVKSLAA